MPNGRTQMNRATPAGERVTFIGERKGQQLAIKHTVARGLGKIISRPDSLDWFDPPFDYLKPRESTRLQLREISPV
jgi:hypothetical protein